MANEENHSVEETKAALANARAALLKGNKGDADHPPVPTGFLPATPAQNKQPGCA